MKTILGAGGAIGTVLVRELLQAGQCVRQVGRSPMPVPDVIKRDRLFIE